MPGTNYMKKVKERMAFSESMRPSALRKNKEIPEGPEGAGLKALPSSVVETMGYKPITRLNRNMEMETLKPINAPAMGALTRPMEQMPLSRMYNSALPRASKLSKAKFPLMPTKYMNPPKMGTIFSKANKSKKK